MEKKARIPKLSIIVNYYNPGNDAKITATTYLCIESIVKHTYQDYELILSDGSGIISTQFDKYVSDGLIYLPSKQSEGYAQSFNRGLRNSSGEIIILLANDIFVSANWDVLLTQELTKKNVWMTIPYLSYSDYSPQILNFPLRSKNTTPRLITFNVNAFTRATYQAVGDIDETFSGCFNDIDYLVRIRNLKGEVMLVNCGNITHLGRATLTTLTTVNYENDKLNFINKYPFLASKSSDVNWAHEILCPSLLMRVMFKTLNYFPQKSIIKNFNNILQRFESIIVP